MGYQFLLDLAVSPLTSVKLLQSMWQFLFMFAIKPHFCPLFQRAQSASCLFACIFCSNNSYFGKNLKAIRKMRDTKNLSNFLFLPENFFIHSEYYCLSVPKAIARENHKTALVSNQPRVMNFSARAKCVFICASCYQFWACFGSQHFDRRK